MVGHDETDDVRPMPFDGIGLCVNDHTGRHRGDAGGHHPATLFILYDAEPASPCRFKVGMVAQGGYPDTVILALRILVLMLRLCIH
jgi:hypothetical protein